MKLETILKKTLEGKRPRPGEIRFLLGIREPDRCEALFSAARQLRTRYFGYDVFLYGFLYISTFCRNNCVFCFYRRDNHTFTHYRKDKAQIVDAAASLAGAGVHLIDLTLGEDPLFFGGKKPDFAPLLDVVAAVRQAVDLPIMVSPGVVPDLVLLQLARAGVSFYACYQETHSRRLFTCLRPGQNYRKRWQTKVSAHRYGLLIEEGVLSGLGESNRHLARSLAAMARLDADQVRAMSLVPQPGTPLADFIPADPWAEIVAIAVMRLVFPDRLIPASLDIAGLDGLKQRLQAGANVVTSLVPPDLGFAGVAQTSLDIDGARRTPARVLPVLEECGLRPATPADFCAWIKGRQDQLWQEYSLPEAS